jgi:hypothetical protein
VKTFQKLTMLMSLFLLSAIPTFAQMGNGVTFDAPFAFYAGDTKMPAGSYKVSQLDDNGQVLRIENADGSQSALVEYRPVHVDTAPSSSDIAFKKYGKTEFLSRISVQGHNTAMMIAPSKAEQNAAQAAAAVEHSLSAKAR